STLGKIKRHSNPRLQSRNGRLHLLQNPQLLNQVPTHSADRNRAGLKSSRNHGGVPTRHHRTRLPLPNTLHALTLAAGTDNLASVIHKESAK
ncbi:UNVERIFIED_CONTAM: hypothetical protein ABIE34_002956, partial [Jeotgalibacillus campisalis]